MSTEKIVMNSLFGKTELKSTKVELGLIDEISKELSIAFNSQDVETEINNAVAKLQKSLPIYKSVVQKCDEALVKIKDLGITDGFHFNNPDLRDTLIIHAITFDGAEKLKSVSGYHI